MKIAQRTLLLVLSLVGLPILVSCDSASPVAPTGTTLRISASPTRIALNGQAQIRVVAQKPNGTPVNPGTLILFSATVGEIAPSVPTDDSGEVVTILRAGSVFGTSTVTASTGSAEAATVDVKIGLPVGSITLQATPTSVPEIGGKVTLRAIVRDDQGQPLAGSLVNFSTQTGTLKSAGALLTSDSGGTVEDVLNVSAGDLDQLAGDTFRVEVQVGGGSAQLLTSNTTITIQRLPVADFTFGTNNLTVVFTDTSKGRPTKWQWSFGDNNTSTAQNPTHTYSASGTYVVSLLASNSQGEGTVSKFVAVTGQ